MPNRAFAIAPMGAVAAGTKVHGATLTTMVTEKGTMIALRGDITREDSGALEDLLNATNEDSHIINGLRLTLPAEISSAADYALGRGAISSQHG